MIKFFVVLVIIIIAVLILIVFNDDYIVSCRIADYQNPEIREMICGNQFNDWKD